MGQGGEVLTQLRDLGERRIIAELLAPRYGSDESPFGDDCAQLRAPLGGTFVLSTDPCPPPMAHQLGFEDEYYRGWLLGTINLSDLAAAGAEPRAVLSSLQLPATFRVSDLERLLDGLDDCVTQGGGAVIGGNLKEASEVDLTATAIGWCDGPPLRRSGAAVGDHVVLIGPSGEFWAASLALREGILEPDSTSPKLETVLTPRAQVRAAKRLREEGLLTACLDNSDGLFPSLWQLGQSNKCGVKIEKDAFSYPDWVGEVAGELEIDPFRFALGWGDWQLVATCQPGNIDAVLSVADGAGEPARVVGELVDGQGVYLREEAREGKLLELDSQRFLASSWFTSGLEGYIETLRRGPLIQSE